MEIVSNTQMKNIENSIMEMGISQEILMENAGLALYNLLIRNNCFKKKILILAGSGNNGGDSLVLARKLFSNNIKVETLLVYGSDSYRGASKKNFDLSIKFEIPYKKFFDVENFKTYIQNFDIIIDGIFGTGLNKPIDDHVKEIIEIINLSNKEIISIDIPSGINGDNGNILGVAIKAKKTLILGRPKLGNIFYPGTFYCGKLYLDKLSICNISKKNVNVYINSPIKYKERDEDSHKGSFGKILFVGGGRKYYGAPYFNSIGFLKSGGSYANLACPETLIFPLSLKSNEIVFHPLKETREGNISIENLKTIIDYTNNKDFVVLGGGFSQDEEPQRLINILVSKINKPLLIDADGLNAIKDKLDSLLTRDYPTILTPHFNEMSRLCKKSVEEIKENPIEISKKFAEKYNVILILKGSRTIIATPTGKVYVNISGNSSLSIAGSGDILSGVIAAQFALGLEILEACRMGVFLHGLCGDIIKNEIGQDGVLAEDILNHLPKTLKYYRENFENISNTYNIELI